MPPLTYPDQITYYGFCKTDDPYVRKAFPNNPINCEALMRKAEEIQKWTNSTERDVPYEDFNECAGSLEHDLAKHAIAYGTAVLAACGHDAMGNYRPYDVEEIYEPLYRGIDIHHCHMPLLLRILSPSEAVSTWRAFLELSRHPFFEDTPDRFEDILHVFRSLRSLARDEDWIVVGMMRSYYLHKG